MINDLNTRVLTALLEHTIARYRSAFDAIDAATQKQIHPDTIMALQATDHTTSDDLQNLRLVSRHARDQLNQGNVFSTRTGVNTSDDCINVRKRYEEQGFCLPEDEDEQSCAPIAGPRCQMLAAKHNEKVIQIVYGIPIRLISYSQDSNFALQNLNRLFLEDHMYDEDGRDITEDIQNKRIFPLYYKRNSNTRLSRDEMFALWQLYYRKTHSSNVDETELRKYWDSFINNGEGPLAEYFRKMGHSAGNIEKRKLRDIDQGECSTIARPRFGGRLRRMTNLDIEVDGFMDYTGFMFIGKRIAFLPDIEKLRPVVDQLVPVRVPPNVDPYVGYNCFTPVQITAESVHNVLMVPNSKLQQIQTETLEQLRELNQECNGQCFETDGSGALRDLGFWVFQNGNA